MFPPVSRPMHVDNIMHCWQLRLRTWFAKAALSKAAACRAKQCSKASKSGLIAPNRFLERGYKALLDRLVRAAVAGNAWNADHIVPVFRGGGACGLENLRTLCTPCHADVTKQQARERAAERWDGGPGHA